MRDRHRGHPQPLLHLQDQLADQVGHDGIETARRLVTEQNLRVVRNGPRQPDPLSHSPGDLTRQQILDVAKPHHLQALGGDAPAELLREPPILEREGDVVPDRERVEQRPELEHHPDPPHEGVDLGPGGSGHADSVHDDLAPVGAKEPHQRAEQGRLAGPASTDQGEALPPLHLEVDPPEDPAVAETHRDVPHADDGGDLGSRLGRRHQKKYAVTR